MYMNSRMTFRNKKFTHGQYDEYEGVVSNIPNKLLCSADDKKTWCELKVKLKLFIKIIMRIFIVCMELFLIKRTITGKQISAIILFRESILNHYGKVKIQNY